MQFFKMKSAYFLKLCVRPRYLFLFFYSLLLVSLSSCEKEADVKIPDVKAKLVVFSFISPQDSILKVIVRKTMPVFGTRSNNGSDDFKSIKGASVYISDGASRIQLFYDTLHFQYVSAVNELTIETGKEYFLEVSAEGTEVKASCRIPPATQITSIEFDTITEQYSEPGSEYFIQHLEIHANWKDQYTETNYYRIYSEFEFDSERFGYPDSKFEFISFEKEVVSDQEGGNGNFSRKGTSWIDPNMADPKYMPRKYRCYLLTIDKHYYTYHRWLSNNDEDNPFAEPTLVPTNIEGGLGVFAGYNKSTLTIDLKK
jgi:hypothetical protein